MLWGSSFGLRSLLGLDRPGHVDAKTATALADLLHARSNCVDVGAHQGAILARIQRIAPIGRHIAIEPLPEFADRLRRRFPSATVHEVALSDTNGVSKFHHVVRTPAYSGLRRRQYERPDEPVEIIQVRACRLDDLLDPEAPVDFLKIDVEGGELAVLRGSSRTLARHRPAVLFEHGLGAADCYGTAPADIYDLLASSLQYRIFTLDGWLSGDSPLELTAMEREFELCRAYMFLAMPTP